MAIGSLPLVEEADASGLLGGLLVGLLVKPYDREELAMMLAEFEAVA